MEYCKGGKINDMKYIKDNKISVNEISLKVAQMYSLMIYQYGFIHCDPHPGNILIRKPHQDNKEDVEIVLLDHGLYQQLTNDFRLLYCKLWHGLITRDNDSIKKYCQELEAGELYPLLACIITARSWDSIQQGIGSVSRTNIENNLIRNDAYLYFSEITQLLNKVPRQLILILKTNDLLRGLEQSLGSSCHTHSHITMSRHCLRAIYEAEENNKNSLYHRLMLKLKMRMSLFALYMYEWWLKFTT
jgi:aarF domain-containing kinase